MRRLLDAAAAAGLLVPDVTYESHGIADAPTSFFVLTADGCTHRVNAYALTESDSSTGLDQATIDARAEAARVPEFADRPPDPCRGGERPRLRPVRADRVPHRVAHRDGGQWRRQPIGVSAGRRGLAACRRR